MADVLHVAACVLDQTGPISTMKLQKLVFYANAYHLVSYDTPLFPDAIEAWANGPVVRKLFNHHRKRYVIGRDDLPVPSCAETLTIREKQSVRHVVERVGSLSGAQLSDLTHAEEPWLNQRRGVAPGDRSENRISHQSIKDFYGSSRCTNPVFA